MQSRFKLLQNGAIQPRQLHSNFFFSFGTTHTRMREHRPTQAFCHLFSSCSCSVSAPLHWFKSLDGMLSSSVKQQQL